MLSISEHVASRSIWQVTLCSLYYIILPYVYICILILLFYIWFAKNLSAIMYFSFVLVLDKVTDYKIISNGQNYNYFVLFQNTTIFINIYSITLFRFLSLVVHKLQLNVSTFIKNNIPASPAYGVQISQIIRYSRPCAQYSDFLDRAQLLTQKLLKQGYVAPRLKSSLLKFYGCHHNLVDRYEISSSQMTMDRLLFTQMFFSPLSLPRLLPDLTVYMSNTAGVL